MAADPTGQILLDRVVRFGRYLRTAGLPVTLGQMMDTVRAVDAVGLEREDFKLAARAALVTRKEDIPLFDGAFDLYWQAFTLGQPAGEPDETLCADDGDEPRETREARLPPPGDEGTHITREGDRLQRSRRRDDDAGEEEPREEIPVLTYSRAEQLRHTDFAQFTADEMEDARALMRRIAWRVGERRSRRTTPSRKGVYLDMRRSLRSSLSSGESMELARRRHKLKPRQLVAICDVSGSMDRYSRLLLQFLHTVEQGPNPVEVFVFGTRLTRITRQLRHKRIDDALGDVAREVQDWSGGTRIGESLRTFNTRWSRRVLRRGAVVLVISDGWDRGDPDLLRTEMARLQRSAHRLIWLNPLLGSPTYEPLTRGIRAALPYVDDFLPVHNLDSLEALARTLADVPPHRPVRRQSAHLAATSAGTIR